MLHKGQQSEFRIRVTRKKTRIAVTVSLSYLAHWGQEITKIWDTGSMKTNCYLDKRLKEEHAPEDDKAKQREKDQIKWNNLFAIM